MREIARLDGKMQVNSMTFWGIKIDSIYKTKLFEISEIPPTSFPPLELAITFESYSDLEAHPSKTLTDLVHPIFTRSRYRFSHDLHMIVEFYLRQSPDGDL